MAEEKLWEERYRTGDLPWDSNKPDFNLVKMVASEEVKPGRALEIGCGTGTNSVWLADSGFSVAGIDISERAVRLAVERATREGADCSFSAMDFLEGEITGSPFDFIYDRGCFHSIDSKESREDFARKVADLLRPQGKWLSIIGNSDGLPRAVGPPTLTAEEIVTLVEPSFEILNLTTSHFEDDVPDSPRAWVCLMTKRQVET